MIGPIFDVRDERLAVSILTASDACYAAHHNGDKKSLSNMIAEAESGKLLNLLIEHWGDLLREARYGNGCLCRHRSDDESAVATMMLESPPASAAVKLLNLIHEAVPGTVLLSHYVVVHGSIEKAADRSAAGEMAQMLTSVTVQMWHNLECAAKALSEEELSTRRLRRAAVIMARALALKLAPGEPFVVVGGRPGEVPEYVISSADAPAEYSDVEQRLTAVGTRIVGLIAAGKERRIEPELRNRRNVSDDTELRALVLTLALWLSRRVQSLPPFAEIDEAGHIEAMLNRL